MKRKISEKLPKQTKRTTKGRKRKKRWQESHLRFQEAKMTLLTLLFFAWEKFSGYKLYTKRKRESRNFALRVLSKIKNLAREKKRDFSGS